MEFGVWINVLNETMKRSRTEFKETKLDSKEFELKNETERQ